MKVWNTLKTTYKVSDFIGWQKDGALKLNPNFQRRSVWRPGAKSYLMDTIIRGLPIPMIFLRDLKANLKTFTPVRDVVDGQQRLRTVIGFIAPHLLEDFDEPRDGFRIWKEHNEELQGKSFRELPKDVQSQILDYQFSVNVFPSDTDDREVKQVFSRMNSSGYKLNAQELRNAEFFGAFKSLAEKLANEQLNRWRDWRIFTPDALARMNEVELSSEFMILMLQGISEKSDSVISGVYRKYDSTFENGPEIAKRFRRVFETLADQLSDDVPRLFRKRTMFYALFAAVYDLQFGLGSDLKAKKAKALPKPAVNRIRNAAARIEAATAPEAVMNATTRRTTHVRERKALVAYLLKTV
jgi:Protein of unknown function DUF262